MLNAVLCRYGQQYQHAKQDQPGNEEPRDTYDFTADLSNAYGKDGLSTAEVIQLIVALIRDAPPPKKPRSPFGNRATPAKLAQYAIVSCQWQAIVERMIWQKISINKKGSLEQLREFTSGNSYRRAREGYIRHILWSPEINRRDLHAKTQGDDVRVQLLPDWYFQQCQSSILDLFKLLEAWKDRQTNLGLSLWLSDDDYLDVGDDEEIERQEWESLNIDQLWRTGQVPNFLHLTAYDIQNVSTLPYDTCFKLHEVRDSNVRPSAFFRLLSRFPHVQHVSSGQGRLVPRGALQALADQRQGISLSLPSICTDYSCRAEIVDHLSLVPESVETFTYSIFAQRELSINPAHNAANYLSSQGLDDFSIAFRTLSTRLRDLRLDGVRISSALFWPVAEEKVDTKSLYWPNMVTI